MRHSSMYRTAASITALALTATWCLPASPAQAERRGSGILGTAIGIGAGLAILNGLDKGGSAKASPQRSSPSGSSRSRSKSNSDDDDDDTASNTGSTKKSKEKSAEERAADARNHATQQAELAEIRRTEQLEEQRDVQKAIRSFLTLLEDWHKTLRQDTKVNVKVSTGSNINQVTEGEIKRAVEQAYKTARLYEFEKLAGEIWTRDRLTVRVIDYSRKELEEFFKGVGVKGASMADIEQVFERSARHVYGHALQVAEMIGVSHSFDRFIRTIYEHSDRADESLSTIGSDGSYERMVATLVDGVPRQTFISDDQVLASDPLGLEKQFLFRFRARRVLYDCMAARYSDLISGGGQQQQGRTITIADRGNGGRSGAPGIAASAGQPSGGQDTPDVWERLREMVKTGCNDPLGAVMGEAKDGRIQPKPARWDSSGGDASLGGKPALFPATGPGPGQPR